MATPTFKTPVIPSNFGGLVNDANRNAMTGALGSWFQTSDATGTPKNSPLTVSNSAVPIAVPTRAVQMTLSTNNDLRISELSDVSTYYILAGGTAITIDIARLGILYLLRDGASDCTVKFMFNMV